MSQKRGMTASPREIEWQCPYCDATEPTLRDIQDHITESTEGDHEGISGESPDEDIIGVDPETGDEIDRYERTDVVRPQDAPLEGVSKRKQVVYGWLANDREEDPDAIASVTDADRDYAVQILGQIRRGEITRDYWADEMDQELLAALEERLENYDPDRTMSTQQQEADDSEEVASNISDKDIILNVYDLLGDDINRKEVWQALSDAGVFSSGYEYFRREYKSAVDGEIDEDTIEEAVSDQIQSAIEPALIGVGALAEDTGGAGDGRGSDKDTEPASTSVDVGSEVVEGEVQAEDIREVREKLELLHEESQTLLDVDESVGARRAEFIGSKAIEMLDDLLEE